MGQASPGESLLRATMVMTRRRYEWTEYALSSMDVTFCCFAACDSFRFHVHQFPPPLFEVSMLDNPLIALR